MPEPKAESDFRSLDLLKQLEYLLHLIGLTDVKADELAYFSLMFMLHRNNHQQLTIRARYSLLEPDESARNREQLVEIQKAC
jgi:hypothetical protein